MAKPANPQYEFGPFQLNPDERLLLRDEEPVALTPKAFDTLCYFVEHHQRLLTKDELIAQLWPDSFVEEQSGAERLRCAARFGRKAGWPSLHRDRSQARLSFRCRS